MENLWTLTSDFCIIRVLYCCRDRSLLTYILFKGSILLKSNLEMRGSQVIFDFLSHFTSNLGWVSFVIKFFFMNSSKVILCLLSAFGRLSQRKVMAFEILSHVLIINSRRLGIFYYIFIFGLWNIRNCFITPKLKMGISKSELNALHLLGLCWCFRTYMKLIWRLGILEVSILIVPDHEICILHFCA